MAGDPQIDDDAAAPADLAATFAAVLDWWREAGVDHAFHDTATQWISPAPEAAQEAARLRAADQAMPDPLPPPMPPAPGARPRREPEPRSAPASAPASASAPWPSGDWPRDLAGFAEWWIAEPWLDDGRRGERVPPRGHRGAALMVLVPEPEQEDGDRLLAGPQGALLAGFLAAADIAESRVYVASVLPRHTPAPDWSDVAARGLGALLAHHVWLVRPERLISFGDCIPPLLGHAPTKMPAAAVLSDQEGRQTPWLAVRALSVISRPASKRELWQCWLDWAP